MLTQVAIQNFRCFPRLKVPLRPLTVLIGQNDTGKSAFLSAILKLTRISEACGRSDHWQCDNSSEIALSGWVGGERIRQTYRADKSGDSSPADQQLTLRWLTPTTYFQLPSSGLALQCSGLAEGEPDLSLGQCGENVPALIDHLLRRDRSRFDAIVNAVQRLVPGFHDFDIATPKPELRRLDLVVESGLVMAPESVSVGVRTLLFFVALAYHPQPPRLILLEEPENGVHPRRLGEIIALLREITEGKHGQHAAQVILTTHSPYLLDHIDVERDQVLVFRRNDDGSRTAEPVDQERLKNFLDEFMLGEVWYNESEEGLVGRQ